MPLCAAESLNLLNAYLQEDPREKTIEGLTQWERLKLVRVVVVVLTNIDDELVMKSLWVQSLQVGAEFLAEFSSPQSCLRRNSGAKMAEGGSVLGPHIAESLQR